jgi:hypothetical protein
MLTYNGLGWAAPLSGASGEVIFAALGAITKLKIHWICGKQQNCSSLQNHQHEPHVILAGNKTIVDIPTSREIISLEGYMLSNPPRILCIGKDSGLLRSRCAVLAHAGYDAQAVMFAEAKSLLQTAGFDLIILSAILTIEEKEEITAFIGGTIPILALKKLTFASELLAEIEQRLQQAKQDSVA